MRQLISQSLDWDLHSAVQDCSIHYHSRYLFGAQLPIYPSCDSRKQFIEIGVIPSRCLRLLLMLDKDNKPMTDLLALSCKFHYRIQSMDAIPSNSKWRKSTEVGSITYTGDIVCLHISTAEKRSAAADAQCRPVLGRYPQALPDLYTHWSRLLLGHVVYIVGSRVEIASNF